MTPEERIERKRETINRLAIEIAKLMPGGFISNQDRLLHGALLNELQRQKKEAEEQLAHLMQLSNETGVAPDLSVPATPTADVPKAFEGLGQKKTDLARYFDDADLTERQRQCCSMKYEYELRASEIARRLDLNRKTVEEHLDAGHRRLARDAHFKRALKRRIAHHGSYDKSH